MDREAKASRRFPRGPADPRVTDGKGQGIAQGIPEARLVDQVLHRQSVRQRPGVSPTTGMDGYGFKVAVWHT